MISRAAFRRSRNPEARIGIVRQVSAAIPAASRYRTRVLAPGTTLVHHTPAFRGFYQSIHHKDIGGEYTSRTGWCSPDGEATWQRVFHRASPVEVSAIIGKMLSNIQDWDMIDLADEWAEEVGMNVGILEASLQAGVMGLVAQILLAGIELCGDSWCKVRAVDHSTYGISEDGAQDRIDVVLTGRSPYPWPACEWPGAWEWVRSLAEVKLVYSVEVVGQILERLEALFRVQSVNEVSVLAFAEFEVQGMLFNRECVVPPFDQDNAFSLHTQVLPFSLDENSEGLKALVAWVLHNNV